MVNTARNSPIITAWSYSLLHWTYCFRKGNSAEATGDSIGNKIADKITKVSKTSPRDNSEIVTNEIEKEILENRYISSE